MIIPLYENKLIALVPFSKDLAKGEDYISWFNDPEVTRYNSHGLFPYTKEQAEKFWEGIDNRTNIVFAILAKDLDSGEDHIGNCSLDNIDWINRSACFNIVIGNKNYWKKGIGAMCLEFLLEHAFMKLNLFRVWTGAAEVNVGMIRVAIKSGMEIEGLFRRATYLNGKYYDIREYGILKDEWERRVGNKA